MRNEPNFRKSQMFITLVLTMDYNEKAAVDTWSKRTQTKPTCLAEALAKADLSGDNFDGFGVESLQASQLVLAQSGINQNRTIAILLFNDCPVCPQKTLDFAV